MNNNIMKNFKNTEIKISGYEEDITVKIINIEADNYLQLICITTHIYIDNDTKNYIVKAFNIPLLEFLGYNDIEDIFNNTEIVNNFMTRFIETIQSHNDALPVSAMKEHFLLKLQDFCKNKNISYPNVRFEYSDILNGMNIKINFGDKYFVISIKFDGNNIIVSDADTENTIGIYKSFNEAYNMLTNYLSFIDIFVNK